MQQPGSRLYYISAATGSDATGDIYFWDGSRIIDSAGRPADAVGVAYGTDPMNPSAAVKEFKRWAYVGPRRWPSSDIGSEGLVGGATPAAREGFPDWWMFKRGETFDLAQDLLSFARQTDPTVNSVNSSLAVPGGRSPTERQIVGAYGNVCLPRPRFVHPMLGFVSRYADAYTPVFKNVAYLSLHFDGHDRLATGTYSGITLIGQTPASTDILFEDVWVDAATVNIGAKNSGQITFRRSLITDAFNTDGTYAQGVYYEGTRDGVLRFEESILLRNGFSHGDPKTLAWPPTGTQIWHMNGRNLYLYGETNWMRSGMFDSVSMMGASGDQFRAGMRVERNFFYQGYVGVGAHGGYPDAMGPTGTIVDNVLQRFVGTGTNDNRGQPGWGFTLGGGAYSVQVTGNIVTGSQYGGTGAALQFQPTYQNCDVPFQFATRSNVAQDNVFDSGSTPAVVTVSDGADKCYGWVFPGVRDNRVSNNVLVNSLLHESEYTPVGLAVGSTSDTAYGGNKIFRDRSSAAVALGWTGADRTLKTYMAASGITVSSADGFPEYFAQASQQRRGQWRSKWSARELVNYFRAGFGKGTLQ